MGLELLGAGIIAGLTGATSMAVGAAPFAAAVGAAAIGAGGYGLYQGTQALSGGAKKSAGQPSAPALPSAPSYASAGEGAEGLKKTARRRTSTILTSPLKGGEEFGTAAPTLLGSGAGKKKTGE